MDLYRLLRSMHEVIAYLENDAIIHIENTRTLEPLEPTSIWVAGETPETYPTGL